MGIPGKVGGKRADSWPTAFPQGKPRENPGWRTFPCSPGVSQGESWIPGKTLGFTWETLPAENSWNPTKTQGFS